jgi:cytoskeletal protein RodZ
MSSTPFGEHLKREREMRGVSLEEIAAATRISTRFLEAIEGERWDQLPGGVFNRGFIRSIARFLGMDEDNLVAEYDLDAKSNGAPRFSAAVRAAHRMPRNWRPPAVALSVLVLLVSGGLFTYVRYGSRISNFLRRGVAEAAVRVHQARGTRSPASHQAVPPPASLAARQTSPSASDPGSLAPLILKLEVGKPANVTVLADGAVLFRGPVHVNEVKQFQARESFKVSSSESSALLLELNGQTVPPIGTPGGPGSITLTHKDLNPSAGGSH